MEATAIAKMIIKLAKTRDDDNSYEYSEFTYDNAIKLAKAYLKLERETKNEKST